MECDIFTSHASEDSEEIVGPLAQALTSQGLRVWLDEFALKLGDSFRCTVEQGSLNLGSVWSLKPECSSQAVASVRT
jgi:hypothetical protein